MTNDEFSRRNNLRTGPGGHHRSCTRWSRLCCFFEQTFSRVVIFHVFILLVPFTSFLLFSKILSPLHAPTTLAWTGKECRLTQRSRGAPRGARLQCPSRGRRPTSSARSRGASGRLAARTCGRPPRSGASGCTTPSPSGTRRARWVALAGGGVGHGNGVVRTFFFASFLLPRFFFFG